MENFDTIVIGAGLTGLSAARESQRLGASVLVIEKNSFIGGRVHSIKQDDCILDYGFQVVLPSYPALKQLNLNLTFRPYKRGAVIVKSPGQQISIDPFKILLSNSERIGAFSDYIKLTKMIFLPLNLPTYQVLKDSKLTCSFKNDFLNPFLRGVLLDYKLETSWITSSFYLKQFIFGGASLLKGGIGDLPGELSKNLNIILNCEVERIENNQVICKNGKTFSADKIIQTAPQFQPKDTEWHATSCFYFLYTEKVKFNKCLALFPEALPGEVNHLTNLSEINDGYSPKGTSLFSVSTIGISIKNYDEIARFTSENLKLDLKKLKFIKCFNIENALPITKNTPYDGFLPQKSSDNEHLYFASDILGYASQNSALTIGRDLVRNLNEN